MNSEETLKLFQRYVIPNYGRFPVVLARGEGSHVWLFLDRASSPPLARRFWRGVRAQVDADFNSFSKARK